MEKKKFVFSQKTTSCYFHADVDYLNRLTDRSHAVIITDENIYRLHKEKLNGWKTIILPPGEGVKVQSTIDHVIRQLIDFKADRKSFLIGVGGGVITDITGYVASIYMRGIGFGFVPTSLLAMVDASIGGKNGIDVGAYKNFVGTVRQPDFLLYNSSFLTTLPESEWVNGFAEVIKHACIHDIRLFAELLQKDISHYQKNDDDLQKLIRRNVVIKSGIVQSDEFEQNERRLLNFGHTWGHAVETTLSIPHGHAVAIGMVMACRISEQLTGFTNTEKVVNLISGYGLPSEAEVDRKRVFEVLTMDKKKVQSSMNYVLLEKIGKAVVRSIPMAGLEKLINEN